MTVITIVFGTITTALHLLFQLYNAYISGISLEAGENIAENLRHLTSSTTNSTEFPITTSQNVQSPTYFFIVDTNTDLCLQTPLLAESAGIWWRPCDILKSTTQWYWMDENNFLRFNFDYDNEFCLDHTGVVVGYGAERCSKVRALENGEFIANFMDTDYACFNTNDNLQCLVRDFVILQGSNFPSSHVVVMSVTKILESMPSTAPTISLTPGPTISLTAPSTESSASPRGSLPSYWLTTTIFSAVCTLLLQVWP